MARPRILVVAGHEPSGRAGALADSEAVLAAGGLPCVCLSAITAQPERGEVSIFPASVPGFTAQLEAVLGEGPPAAIKIGMVAHPHLVQALLERLTHLPPVPVVVDPVLSTSTGASLLVAGSRRAVYRELARLRPVMTPNLPELGVLTGRASATSEAEEIRQSELILAWGATAVLVKGGHRGGSAHDLLVTADGEERTFPGTRLTTKARGKGCRLSSILATFLAQGIPLEEAVERARHHVRLHLEAHPG